MKNKCCALIFALLLLSACDQKKETASPEIKNLTESVYASGVVKSKNQYEVYSKVNGIVNNILVSEGDFVLRDQLLFTIENPNAGISVDNARLSADLNDFKKNTQKLNEAIEAIQIAQKSLSSDSLLFERQKNLWKQNIGSKVELEQRELAFEKSKVAWKQAKTKYHDLKRQLELASLQSKNNLEISQNSEKDLEVRSKISGVVYKINIRQGELTAPGNPAAIIGEDDFLIELGVDELDIVKVKKGLKVMVRMDSYKNDIFEATVTRVHPIMNERTRTFIVEAVFAEKPAVLYPNLTLEANIVISQKQNVLTIPTRFLLPDSTVMLDDKSIRKVEIGLSDFNLTEIKSGINAESKIMMPD